MSLRRPAVLALQCSNIALLAAMAGSGCSSAMSAQSCAVDGDCSSNFCKADGTCATVTPDGGAGGDTPTDTTTGACTPDHDGRITFAELPLIAGRTGTFRTATNVSLATGGHANGDGSRTWDFTSQLSGDSDDKVALAAPTGAWWASDFPMATYAAPLSATADLVGVFETSAAQVTLIGVVSPDGGALATKLTYDPPAKILALPFAAGDTWSSTSTVSGLLNGVLSAYSETYASRVDEVGTMVTPYGPFPVVRVATDLTRTAGVATLLTKRSFAWMAECFGSVASLSGKDFDTAAELTSVAEVRRLAP